MWFIVDDLLYVDVVVLIEFYICDVYVNLLLGSVFVFDVLGLCEVGVILWLVWDDDGDGDGVLLGLGVFKWLDVGYGELKLMWMYFV